jgi:hypothetical protein
MQPERLIELFPVENWLTQLDMREVEGRIHRHVFSQRQAKTRVSRARHKQTNFRFVRVLSRTGNNGCPFVVSMAVGRC